MRESAGGPPSKSVSGRRAPGEVRAALIEAGMELARSGGPDAVVLREATRRVGVVPNAAYRHFADRSALLAAVGESAMSLLAAQMHERMASVRPRRTRADTAVARLMAVGRAYLDFARHQTGLFEAAFASPGHLDHITGSAGIIGGGGASGATRGPVAAAVSRGSGFSRTTPFDVLAGALDDLVTVGVLTATRRQDAEYPIWASVHGMAALTARGPLSGLPEQVIGQLSEQLLEFIARAV